MKTAVILAALTSHPAPPPQYTPVQYMPQQQCTYVCNPRLGGGAPVCFWACR
jgi:hypothetical protein